MSFFNFFFDCLVRLKISWIEFPEFSGSIFSRKSSDSPFGKIFRDFGKFSAIWENFPIFGKNCWIIWYYTCTTSNQIQTNILFPLLAPVNTYSLVLVGKWPFLTTKMIILETGIGENDGHRDI